MVLVAVRLGPAAQPAGGVVPRAGHAIGRAEGDGELSLGAELAEAVDHLAVHPGWAGHALAAAAGLPAGSTISDEKYVQY